MRTVITGEGQVPGVELALVAGCEPRKRRQREEVMDRREVRVLLA